MKKIYLLLFCLGLFTTLSNAQDTLLWENFEDTIIGDISGNYFEDLPSGVTDDSNWYNYDEDQLPDGSGNNRPSAWGLTYGFADVDSTSIVAYSNSWTNDGATFVKNWLITPAIQLTDTSARVYWKTAPFQTPYYCDGYKIYVSSATNDVSDFTALYTAGQYESGACDNSNNYAAYTFSSGFIHGQDGTFTQLDPASLDGCDSSRQRGVLREFSLSLSAYAGQKVYIAFVHETIDDNLLSLDDILVTEFTDPTFGVEENTTMVGSVYPNPADQFINLSFDMSSYHNMNVSLVDSKGATLYTSALTTGNAQINTSNIANGIYYVKIKSDEGSRIEKVVINH